MKEPTMSDAVIPQPLGNAQATPRLANPAQNPFLQGPFAPVDKESTSTTLKVTGQLPTDLNGLYVRIGPNPLKAPTNPKKHHWFTGDGMVHGLQLQGGQAQWYRNRYIGSKTVNKALGRPIIEGKPRGVFDTVNTNVFGHAGRIWASVEAGPSPIQLDAELNSVRHSLIGSEHAVPFTAHPHLDPITGDLHAICYDAMKHNEVYYVRIGAQGGVDKVTPIPVKHGPMIHDCAITRSKVVVLDLPVTFSWWSLLKRESFPYAWNPKHPARVGLLPREGQGSDTRWYDVDPCYVFHPCNAYDLPDGSVVMDVVVHQHLFDQSRVGPEADTNPVFERWTLPVNSTRVVRELICSRFQEFPRLNETLVGQPYRYAYAVEFTVDNQGGQSVLKHDLQARQTLEHRFEAHRKPGEFVFVPRATSASEDDGWLIGYAYNLATNLGEFHVLDAKHMDAPAQAIVELPARVPMGFHGNWISAPPA
jgi:8'-apo-carotenoid 13,14-cleaving dioxygenase